MDVQSTDVVQEETPKVTEEIQEVATEEVVEPKTEETKIEDEVTEKDPDWYKKRIDRFTKKLYEERTEKERLRDELKKYKTERSAPVAPVPTQFIDENGYMKSEEYQKAMSEYLEKHENYKRDRDEAVMLDKQYQDRLQERMDVFRNQVDQLRAENPDIDTAISKPIFSKPLEAAIYESDDSARVALYLGRNEAEAWKLNQLAERGEAWKIPEYIGRIEEKLAFLEKKKTKATEPIKPLDGKLGNHEKKEEDMSDQEWADWRKQQKRMKRG